MPSEGIRTQNLSRRAAADLCVRPRGYWDWQLAHLQVNNTKGIKINVHSCIKIATNTRVIFYN